jgi:hypothetical protein
MRVLITGGAGLLGSQHPDFEFYEHDVSIGIYDAGPVGVTARFASAASPRDQLRMPIEYRSFPVEDPEQSTRRTDAPGTRRGHE